MLKIFIAICSSATEGPQYSRRLYIALYPSIYWSIEVMLYHWAMTQNMTFTGLCNILELITYFIYTRWRSCQSRVCQFIISAASVHTEKLIIFYLSQGRYTLACISTTAGMNKFFNSATFWPYTKVKICLKSEVYCGKCCCWRLIGPRGQAIYQWWEMVLGMSEGDQSAVNSYSRQPSVGIR